LKLWLLDADIVIDLLSLDLFDALAKGHEVHVASTVADEVRYFRKGEKKYRIDFRQKYIESRLVKEVSATTEQTKELLFRLPPIFRETLDPGELESLAVLCNQPELIFCTCDAAAIRMLPFLDAADRGVSAESLLRMSGLSRKGLKANHTEDYFKTNLKKGMAEKIYRF
jgi:hypothetical protein